MADKFYGKLWTTGDSTVVTIPKSLIKYGGYNSGDEVEIMIKKKIEKAG